MPAILSDRSVVLPAAAIKAAYDALADDKSGEEPYSTAPLDSVELVVEEIEAAFHGGG